MEEYIKIYFQNYTIMLVLIFLIMVLLTTDLGVSKKAKFFLGITGIIVFALSIINTTDVYITEETEGYPTARFILTLFKYIGPQAILCIVITSIGIKKRINLILYAALLIEIILLSISQSTHLVYYIADSNLFKRGSIWLLPFVMSFIYFVTFIITIIYKFKSQRFEFIFLLSGAVMCSIITTLETLDIISNQLYTGLAASILFYEIYLYYMNSSKDFLTGILNRQSFINDLNNNKKRMAALISMDLNGLKNINDTQGHTAGDKALIAAARSFSSVKGYNIKVYRVGGDEFNAIVYNANEEDVNKIIDRMKRNIILAGYSASIGYVMNDEKYTVDDLINISDQKMYEKKQLFYKQVKEIQAKETMK